MAEELGAGGKGEIKRRRRFSEEFKRQVVAETLSGENSVAGVALRHGLNNNLVFTWRRRQLRALSGVTAMPAKLLPVTIDGAQPGTGSAGLANRGQEETVRSRARERDASRSSVMACASWCAARWMRRRCKWCSAR